MSGGRTRPRIPFAYRNSCPVYPGARSAVPAMAEIAGVDHERAREMLAQLAKAGFAIAPREPTDGMLAAYVSALGQPARHHSVIIHNIGKARRRWAAMASAGTKTALSMQGFEKQETDLESAD